MVSALSFACGESGQDSASGSESESESESESDTDGETEGDTEGDDFEIVRSDVPRDLAPNPSDAERTSDRDGASRFTMQLFDAVTTGPDANVVFSPHSIRTAFGQVHLGTNGVVKSEIETVLGFDAGDRTHAVLNAVDLELSARNFAGESDADGGELPPIELSVANSLFSDHSFAERVNADFLDALAANYDAGIRIVPFDTDLELARQRLNGWVAGQTHDKIPELIKAFPSAVELVVVNALYFKASWETPFEDELTSPAAFQTLAGTSVQVDTMHAYTLSADYAESESEWQAIALPYSDPRLQMVVIVPANHVAFEDGFDGEQLDAIFDELAPSTIDLSLPKFQVRSPFSLKTALESLGMNAPFSDVSGFSGIPTSSPIFDVIHETFIAVDEKGTEAAAATAIIFGDGGGEEPVTEHVVDVDRTFYLAIRDRGANALLFFGRIGDPSKTAQ